MISTCILTKNSGATLQKTLDSLTSFPEVILLDNGSSDNTLSLAAHYPNVKIFTSPFVGFGPLRNKAATLASYDWILSIDSDEILSAPLIAEIAHLSLDPNTIYALSRHNFYRGKHIQGCGWHPEKVLRLYHKQNTCYCSSLVHESIQKGVLNTVTLQNPILHTPYRHTSDFLAKMQHYSTLFATQNHNTKKSSFCKALGHALFAFFRSYLLQRGIFDGMEGFLISFYNANTTFYKYIKLKEMNDTGPAPIS